MVRGMHLLACEEIGRPCLGGANLSQVPRVVRIEFERQILHLGRAGAQPAPLLPLPDQAELLNPCQRRRTNLQASIQQNPVCATKAKYNARLFWYNDGSL